jgi:hypothetical protein
MDQTSICRVTVGLGIGTNDRTDPLTMYTSGSGLQTHAVQRTSAPARTIVPTTIVVQECALRRGDISGLTAKSPVSGEEFRLSHTESLESRGESLLEDFSISEIWIGEPSRDRLRFRGDRFRTHADHGAWVAPHGARSEPEGRDRLRFRRDRFKSGISTARAQGAA